MRVIVFGSSAPDITVEHEEPLTCQDLLAGDGFTERVQALQPFARPAASMFAGRHHLRMMAAVETLRSRRGREAVNIAFVSPVIGVVQEQEAIVPCRGTFAEVPKPELSTWSTRLDLHRRASATLQGHDLAIYLLEGKALRALQLPLAGADHQRHIFIVNRDDARLIPKSDNVCVLFGGQADATAYGVNVTELRIYVFERLCALLAENDEATLRTLHNAKVAYQELISPILPDRPVVPAFHQPFDWTTKRRVRFFMPECDDRVDAGFDFLNDEYRLHRLNDLDDAFAHDPELYGQPNYDGILVSRNQVEEGHPRKKALVEEVGIHRYLRVPNSYPVMGDCGAYAYHDKPRPRYETHDILRYYARLGFDYGVSIDHMIFPPIYIRPYWAIVRLDGSHLTLQEDELKQLRSARTLETKIAALEETVTYLPEEGLVMVQRKLLKGADAHPGTWPKALQQLVDAGQTPPYTASRLARLRTTTYFKARVTAIGIGTKAHFAQMASLMDPAAVELGRFEPMDRSEYDALMRRKADKEIFGETLRQDKLTFFPESEDAALERVQVDLHEIRFRFLLTLRNGWRFKRHHRLGQFAFTPIGAVQGWHGPLFRYAVERFLAWGYQYLAIGGLAKAKTEEILEVLRAIQPALADAPGVDVHLFGVARNDQVDKFIQLGVTSCDSTGPLQKAWLNPTANYFTIDGPTYAAIRIPDPDSSSKGKKAVNEEAGVTLRYLLKLEREVLRMVRAFDRGEAGIEETLDAIMSYDELLGEDRKYRELFRKTLTDQPWKKCPCDVCRKVGVDVIIFRGNDRNRRRGFHNTYVYYQELKRIRENLGDNNRVVQEIQSAIPAPEKPAARMAFEF